MSDSDLHAKSVEFYWADSGDGKTVKVTFKANGIDCEKTATLNVKNPTSTLTVPALGTVRLATYQGSLKVGLFGPGTSDPPDPGILFNASVSVPAGFSAGVWNYVQVLNPTNSIRKIEGSGACEAGSPSGSWLCDTEYPYEPGPHDPAPGSPGSWATGSGVQSTEDNPHLPLAGYSEVRRDQSFSMYVMFKPAGQQSKWVPLRKINWSCYWCTTKLIPGWSLVRSGQNKDAASAETSDHPIWSANAAPQTYQPTQCPPPCSP